jgi:hypothetical protein
MKGKFLAACLFAVASISCTEENTATPFNYSKVFSGENQKTWVVTDLLITKIGEETQSYELDPCERDDRYTFKADVEKSFIVDNGNSACPVEDGEEPEEDIYVEATWSFVNSGATLTIPIPRIFGNFYIPFIVREVTSTHMVLEIFADQDNTISYQVVMNAVDEQ